MFDFAPFLDERAWERLLQVPGAPSRLRGVILQLAVRGRLVPQDEGDESAQVLVERIAKERARRVKAGEMRKSEPLPPVSEDEQPFELPRGWAWTRLEALGQINPRNKAEDETVAAFAPMPVIPTKYGAPVEPEMRPWGEIKKGFTHFGEGDVVLAKITPCFQNAKSAVMEGLPSGIGAGTTELHVFRDFAGMMEPRFVLALLKSPSFLAGGKALMTGTAGQQRVPTEYFARTPFPLPPLAEQKRIVAKVDELMALCDRLEEQGQAAREARTVASQAALRALHEAADAKERAAAWERLCERFDALFDAPEAVAPLRACVLQLAVQGRLVPQNPDDESAQVLAARIAREKASLVREKKLKKSDPLPPVTGEEQPFELPEGWMWTRLGDMVRKMGAGSTPLGGKEVYQSHGTKFLRSQNVWNDGLVLDNVAYISDETHKRMRGTVVEPGDVLLNITGASIGRSAVVSDDFDEANVSQHVAIIRLLEKDIRLFTHLCIISKYFQDTIMEAQVGISREGLSMNRLQSFVVPLPPGDEQRRIVAKVSELMAMCDALEAGLREAQDTGAALWDALETRLRTG